LTRAPAGSTLDRLSSPFDYTAHRPWPLPGRPWIMIQRWHDLLFAHWACSAAALRPLVPPALELETFEGTAWVGVVPFRLTGRPRGLPGVPGASAFAELNVRTYVRYGDKSGVWFFSLDAESALAVAAARLWFHLPYFRATMRVDVEDSLVRYSSARTHEGAPAAVFDAHYRPAGGVSPGLRGSLAYFLTERYCLYTVDRRDRLWRGDIHHPPWPLQPAHAVISHNTMAEAAGIHVQGEPVLHFSRFQDVRLWALTPVRV
jgi:uncharacterized protein